MRLTHIKLAGFKSFIDPTTIHIPSQLVAVIGPNGCGKSNVIDAVRWVLGEASAKQLRGESMQDVIFNGASTRRPAPRASVELVFDNSDHTLQGAWGQYNEISIKRQLTRQGESSYFINHQPVRRRDITDLFLGTGVGARGYAVIEQGMISRIIEARPEELRAYIEEAAGVSKYKERRRETEARLKDTREHLQRLADLQTELARQVEKLEKQANTASRYQTLKNEWNHLKQLLHYIQWQQSLADADRAGEAHHIAQYQHEQFAEHHQQLNEQIQHLRETETEQQQHHHALNQEHALLREQMARLEEQIRAQQHQHQRAERERLAAQNALHKIQQEQIAIQSEYTLLEAEMHLKQETLSEYAQQVAEHETQLPELEHAQQNTLNAHQSQQDEFNRIKRELALKQQQRHHTEESLHQNQSRQSQLQQEQTTLNQTLPNPEELNAAQTLAHTLQQQYEALQAAAQADESLLQECRHSLHTANTQHQTLLQEQLSAQAQLTIISDLLAQQNTPQEDAWAHTEYANTPILWQNIHVPSAWQHALNVLLAQRIHTRMLPEPFHPTENPSGIAWTYPSGSLNKKNQPAQALINQIHAEKPFQAVLQHWLDGVLCAPNLDYALTHQQELQGHHIWLTPEGHRVDKLSVLLHTNDDTQTWQHQLRQNELKQTLAELTPRVHTAATELAKIQAETESCEQKCRQWQAEQRQCATELQTAQNRANQLLAQNHQGQMRQSHIKQELAQLIETEKQYEQQHRQLNADIATLSEAAHSFEQAYLHLNQSVQQHQHALKQAQLALLESNRQYGLAEIAVHKHQQRMDALQQQLTVLEQQKTEWQERQMDLALADETENTTDQREAEWAHLSQLAHTIQEQINEAQTRLNETQAQGRTLYAQQQTLASNQPKLQEEVQKTLLEQQEALINVKRYHQHLVEAQADLLALEAQAQNADDVDTMSRQITQLNNQIQSLGAVNLAALDELAEAQERDAYYRHQSDDVQAAIALLEEAIGQIDDETKSRFKETFDIVNQKVQQFFPTLFGGGEASVQMVGDDLLTAGVSIMARPPGKKNSTIHLLSGGEKALTAMSLVFALFSLNPAPFCLLDEVDAPLDDANTARFCQLVKEMSAQTQFLYISHNRLTMEMAEQLIGVTMQEKGVSRIVAVDIQQALNMAERG